MNSASTAHTRRGFACSVRQPCSPCFTSTTTAITSTSALKNSLPTHFLGSVASSPSAPSSLAPSSTSACPPREAQGLTPTPPCTNTAKLHPLPARHLTSATFRQCTATDTCLPVFQTANSPHSPLSTQLSQPSCSSHAHVTSQPHQQSHLRQPAGKITANVRQPISVPVMPYRPYSTAHPQTTTASGVCLGARSPERRPGRTVAGWLAATAASLLVTAPPPLTLAPFVLLEPAAARIPTEVILYDKSSAERTALEQLAVPGSMVMELTGVTGLSSSTEGPEVAVQGNVPSAVQIRSMAGDGAAAASSAPRVTGVMVGTPNYARGRGGQMLSGPQQSTATRAAAAIQLLTSARQAVDEGRHEQALELYSRVVLEHPDLALAEYGRIGRAMLLYQVGRTSDSILALEDEEVVMRGAAEVHAALAALLYTERPNLVLRAEQEWNMACIFDSRYSDLEWVRTTQHWPPKMVSALRKFLTLT